jgi:lipopolysaccharide transport system permease protein
MVTSPGEAEWQVIRAGAGRGLGPMVRQLWRHRELGMMLALRDLQLRYRQTLLGISWALLQPLAALLAFTLIFGEAAGLPSDGIPYAAFAAAGLAIMLYLSTAAGAAAESLVEHSDLVTRISFPRLLAPIAAVSAASVDLVISVLLLVPIMAAADVAPPVQVLTVPVWLLLAVVTACGVGFWFAAVNVLYRDVRYALPFVLQFWLFVSPVVFPSSIVDDSWRYLFALNPAAGIIDGLRWAAMDGPAPGAPLVVSIASMTLIAIGGAVYFLHVERSFADRI